MLVCTHTDCLHEYPVIDGVPIIVADLREYVSQSLFALVERQDLSAEIESLLGDCCGPGSIYDVQRQQLSTYAYDHYGDLDPDDGPASEPAPGSVVELLRSGLALVATSGSFDGPVVDIGCATGRSSFELARACDGLVLGVDLNLGMLRVGASIVQGKPVRYPKRRVGVVYDRREFPAALPGADRVDFWVCDASALPLPDGSFALAASLNVIDCLASPHDHLKELSRLLRPDGRAILSTPYDWSAGATPYCAWLGGHSQRSELRGASDVVLRSLLAGGGHPCAIETLQLIAEEHERPWRVRLHDRSAMTYLVHLVALAKLATAPGGAR